MRREAQLFLTVSHDGPRRSTVYDAPTRPHWFEAGPVLLDRAGRHALVAGEEVSLTPREFELLDLLVSEGRAVLRREEIADVLWGRSTLADET